MYLLIVPTKRKRLTEVTIIMPRTIIGSEFCKNKNPAPAVNGNALAVFNELLVLLVLEFDILFLLSFSFLFPKLMNIQLNEMIFQCFFGFSLVLEHNLKKFLKLN